MWKLFNRDGAEKKVPAIVLAPAVRVAKMLANMAVPHATWTAITFDTERLDTDNIHDPAVNPSRLTCQHAGFYVITGQVRWDSSPGGTVRNCAIWLNGVGSGTIISIVDPHSAAINQNQVVTTIYYLNVGDYVELGVYQDSGGAIGALLVGNYGLEFSMVKADGAVISYVASGPGAIGGGWDQINANLAFVSSDGHTFIVSSDVDLTPVMPLGARIRLTHQGVVKYFIVTAVTATQLTLYGGTDYSLSSFAITAPYFSLSKTPMGFPINPLKWSEELHDVAQRSQATPTAGNWYNLGALKLDVPIGAWKLLYELAFQENVASAGGFDGYTSLSTVNNAVSDSDYVAWRYGYYGSAGTEISQLHKEKFVVLTAKTSYYLISRYVNGAVNELDFRGDISPTIVRAICAYL